MNKTICESFGLKPVKPYNNSKATPIAVACASLLYGLELEIENIPNWNELMVSGMTSVADGSLRNNGREFLTTPATLSVVNHVLTTFFAKANLGKVNYSDRCSVHVHANCQDLTVNQVLTVFLLYQLFEDLLFNFVGEDRRDNIYCVPWSQTNIGWNVLNKLGKSIDYLHDWQKYTALNMLPLREIGTIEFRHMHGTNDLAKIITWCNLIGCLFEAAKKYDYEELKTLVLNLNSSSEYRRFLDMIFRQWSDVIRTENFELLLEDGVLNTKYLLTQPEKAKQTKNTNQFVIMDELVAREDDATDPAPINNAVIQQAFADRAVVFNNDGFEPIHINPNFFAVPENRVTNDLAQRIRNVAERDAALQQARVRPIPPVRRTR